MMKLITTCCLAALTAGANAGEVMTSKNPIPVPAATSTGDFFLGGNYREDAWFSYLGMNYAFNGDKNASGFIAQAVAGYGEYEYDTALGGVDGEVTDFDLGLGYQWVTPSYKLSLLGAVNHSDHDLEGNAADLANNSVNGSETGFKAKLDFWSYGGSLIYGGTFTYSTAFDSYWNRAMIAKDFGTFHVGPEFVVQGNEEYEELRAGLTVGGLKLGSATVGVSAGYAWADPKQGNDDQDGIYGAVHASFDF